MKPIQQHKKCLTKCQLTRVSKASKRAPHEKWILEMDGKTIIRTSVPHGRGTLAKSTFSKIVCEQLFLAKDEYEEIYSCKKGWEYYRQILATKKIYPA